MSIFGDIDRQNSPFLQRATSEGSTDPESVEQVINRVDTLVQQVRKRMNGRVITSENMREVFDGLSEYGFSPERIYWLCDTQPAFLTTTWSHQYALLQKFEAYGCTPAQIIDMLRRAPGLITSTWERLHGSQEEPGLLLRLEIFGITKKQLLNALIDDPSFLNNSWERLHGTPGNPGLLLGLNQYGFAPQLLGKMIARYSSFLQKSWEQIHNGTILPMESYGFSHDNIITICGSYPNIFNFSWERIHGTPEKPGLLLQLEQNGFTKEQVIYWCVRVPAMLTYSWDRIKTQLQLATTHDLPISKGLFVQSHQKTAWRFEFLERNGYAVSKSNLFRDHKEFVKRFGQDYESSATSSDEETADSNS